MSDLKRFVLTAWRRLVSRHTFGGTTFQVRFAGLMLALLLAALLSTFVLLTARAGAGSVILLHPPPNSNTAPLTTSIQVSFTVSVDPTTVSTRTVPIHGSQQGLVTGVYTVTDNQISLAPAGPFFPGELVHGTVTTGVHTSTAPALTAPIVWQFRTAAGVGPATFISRPTSFDSTWTLDVGLGDFDDDGDLDIFLNHRDNAGSIWYNDGDGQFTTNGIDLGTSFLVDLALGDLDGDGDLDAIQSGIQAHRILFNDGHGAFSPGGPLFAGVSYISHVVLGDVDGDGDLDALTTRRCDPFDPDPLCDYAVHRIWLNDGAGNFAGTAETLGNGSADAAALGDLDGDGDLDALLISQNAPISGVWTNLGGGVFTQTQALPALLANSASMGDLDGDGDLDAFVSPNAGSDSAVWLNDGNGGLSAGQFLGALGPTVLGDLDGDGDLDAFSITTGADRVWLNQGNATFQFSGQPLGNAESTSVALGDLDGDGDLDAVTGAVYGKPGLWSNEVLHRYLFPLIFGLP